MEKENTSNIITIKMHFSQVMADRGFQIKKLLSTKLSELVIYMQFLGHVYVCISLISSSLVLNVCMDVCISVYEMCTAC